MSIEQTLSERHARYGRFSEHAVIAQAIQDAMRCADGWMRLAPDQKQALTTIADKIARVLKTATTTRARDVHFLTVEPGRISLHGFVLTDAEYATLRAIAERMKRSSEWKLSDLCQHGIHWNNACGACEPARGSKC